MAKLKLPRALRYIHKIWKELGSADGWTPWSGGKPPVEPDDQVGVRFKSASLRTACVSARDVDWKHWGSGTDITAYRIIKKARRTS